MSLQCWTWEYSSHIHKWSDWQPYRHVVWTSLMAFQWIPMVLNHLGQFLCHTSSVISFPADFFPVILLLFGKLCGNFFYYPMSRQNPKLYHLRGKSPSRPHTRWHTLRMSKVCIVFSLPSYFHLHLWCSPYIIQLVCSHPPCPWD